MSKMISRIFASGSRRSSKKRLEKEVTLEIPDQLNPEGYSSLQVSRGLLLEHSGYFREMPEVKFRKLKRIQLEGVTRVALEKMVEFMLEARVTFPHYTAVLETLKASCAYQMEALSNICTDNLITVLDASNVCEIYEPAFERKIGNLEYTCLKLIDEQADEVLQSRGFMTLKKATVKDIIRRNSLNVKSETTVFHAALSWGFNYSLKHNIDPNNVTMFVPEIRPLLKHVRFSAMSEDELRDTEVAKYREMWSSSQQGCTSSVSHSTIGSLPARKFSAFSFHSFNTCESIQYAVKTGDVFYLSAKVLKGRVFITSLSLAFVPFAATSACLCVVVTATNLSTLEQRTARGSFSNTTDENKLIFASPIAARKSERLQIALRVIKADNVCPVWVHKDIQIAMPESKAVFLRLTPVLERKEEEEGGRFIFEEIDYFY